jgi:hypothetical protein
MMDQEYMQDILAEMVEIEPLSTSQFNRVVETLSRIGIPSIKQRTLTQSCHVFHKMGRYFISHFKSLLAMDGKDAVPSDSDLERVRSIALLLENWNLVKILEKEKSLKHFGPICSNIKVLSFDEKNDWNLVVKHSIGKRKFKGS